MRTIAPILFSKQKIGIDARFSIIDKSDYTIKRIPNIDDIIIPLSPIEIDDIGQLIPDVQVGWLFAFDQKLVNDGACVYNILSGLSKPFYVLLPSNEFPLGLMDQTYNFQNINVAATLFTPTINSNIIKWSFASSVPCHASITFNLPLSYGSVFVTKAICNESWNGMCYYKNIQNVFFQFTYSGVPNSILNVSSFKTLCRYRFGVNEL